MLFTTDGELAHKLMHPSMEVEREYAVRVFGEVTEEMITKLKDGVKLEDGPAAFDKIWRKGGEGLNQWFHVTLKEGRQREVRRLWESQGVQVSRFIRVRYGQVTLDNRIPRGGFAEMPIKELQQLREHVGLRPLNEMSKDSQEAGKKMQHKEIMRIRRAVKKHRQNTKGKHLPHEKRRTKKIKK